MLSTSLPVKPQREGIKKFFIHMSGTGKSEFLPQTLEQRRKVFRVPDQIRKTMYCTFLIRLTKAEASEKIVWRVSSWSKGSPMVLYKKIGLGCGRVSYIPVGRMKLKRCLS